MTLKNHVRNGLYKLGTVRVNRDLHASPGLFPNHMVRRFGTVELARRAVVNTGRLALVAVTAFAALKVGGRAIDDMPGMRDLERTQQIIAGRDLPGAEPYELPEAQSGRGDDLGAPKARAATK